jgi:hypothetical protein
MGVAVGIDVAKEFTRSGGCGRAERAADRSSRQNQPAQLQALVEDLQALRAEHGRLRVGIDVVGGVAKPARGDAARGRIQVVHVSQGTSPASTRATPRDAPVNAITSATAATCVRSSRSRSSTPSSRCLSAADGAGRRADQARQPLARPRGLRPSRPGRVVDPTQKASQRLLQRYVTPAETRQRGRGGSSSTSLGPATSWAPRREAR